MNPTSTQQEILLLICSNFSLRNSCKNEESKKNDLTKGQQLEEACWNGLIHQMLPEICDQSGNKLLLWQTRETNSFIEIELGDLPEEKEKHFSIDPYSFLSTYYYS
jgi:hypothetical protein